MVVDVVSAVEFAALIGRYVRMERPAIGPEREGGNETLCVKGVVSAVADIPQGVELHLSGRRVVLVSHANRDDWRFTVHACKPGEEF